VADSVLVLGGGIGGLTAAHELAERGFDVTVLELKKIPGGKSRTIPVPGTGTEGRPDLPGEHGFRFFPGFYAHLPNSMKRIPVGGSGKSAFDNLVPTSRVKLARNEKVGIVGPTRFPQSLDDLELIFKDLFHPPIHFKPGELRYFAARLWQVMTSCKARRLAQLEGESWWDFTGAETRSANYQQFLAEGLSRSLVAAKARKGSARTIGQVQVHLIFGMLSPGHSTDRVLNGPTSDVFLNPWISYLESRRGVSYETQKRVTSFELAGGRISGVRVDGEAEPRTADWYVSALPVEVMGPMTTPDMIEAAPELEHVPKLAKSVRWMNGMQFFLKKDVPIIHGHTLYVDSPWAITSISEAQFWERKLTEYGDGTTKGVLSVDISDWTEDGRYLKQWASRLETVNEIADEVIQELTHNLNLDGKTVLNPLDIQRWFLDTDIELPHGDRPHETINLEPLFINQPHSWSKRPPALTGIENLYLAADYVQTNSDLACMEAANEAARRAVNGILDASDSSAAHCRIWDMGMPGLLALWRRHDEKRFEQGLPWNGKLLG
jgi:uncharacterized protein with NAD-binding domain and iron-sulfur cluster